MVGCQKKALKKVPVPVWQCHHPQMEAMYRYSGRQTADSYIIIGGEKAYVDLLVAETFLVNPDPKAYTEVEHIDGDMSNNAADNLRWIKKQ